MVRFKPTPENLRITAFSHVNPPGTLVAVPPFTLHRTSRSGITRHNERGGFIKLQVLASAEEVKKIPRPGELDPLNIFTMTNYTLYELHQNITTDFEDWVNRLISCTDDKGAGSRQIAQAEFNTLLLRLSRGLEEQKISPLVNDRKSENPEGLLIADLALFLSNNYQKKITLKQLGEQFHRHPKYLCQRFKEETDFTIGWYMNYLRICQAEILLGKGTMTLERVAQSTGFSSLTQFGRVFKKYRGITPSLWQKENREK